mmetsp:Transcript_7424/g.15118  ORF Transcript_7424/g.15118 Transcript_7424/m.15118 type:complete len:238 (+) Transcript_7424:148-861(+)
MPRVTLQDDNMCDWFGHRRPPLWSKPTAAAVHLTQAFEAAATLAHLARKESRACKQRFELLHTQRGVGAWAQGMLAIPIDGWRSHGLPPAYKRREGEVTAFLVRSVASDVCRRGGAPSVPNGVRTLDAPMAHRGEEEVFVGYLARLPERLIFRWLAGDERRDSPVEYPPLAVLRKAARWYGTSERHEPARIAPRRVVELRKVCKVVLGKQTVAMHKWLEGHACARAEHKLDETALIG